MNQKVLIVDDEESIVSVLSYALTKEGFSIEKAYDGEEALQKVEYFKPDMIILDIMLPIINGYEVCRKIGTSNIGILMLTAKNDIVDKLLGLELGADDYITKPFDIREIIARVKSLSRRFQKVSIEAKLKPSNAIIMGDFKLDLDQHSVNIGSSEIELTAKEFELLYLLLSNLNHVFSREQLLDNVWNIDYFGATRTVDTHIQRVRKKLGDQYQNIIATVHGVGYKGVNIFENRNKV